MADMKTLIYTVQPKHELKITGEVFCNSISAFILLVVTHIWTTAKINADTKYIL